MSADAAPEAERVTRLAAAVVSAANALEDAQGELCGLDSVAGDGDEGLAMARAGRAIREGLVTRPPEAVGEILDLVARELSAVGGAMGALSYITVSAIGDDLASHDDKSVGPSRIAELLATAENAVASFGGAHRGDKSVLDAISAARDAAETAATDGLGTLATLQAAAAGAREGAEATAEMQARVGRASRLGERSVGAIDAGAQSFAIVLNALATTYASQT